jgi:hypothetical protein
MRSPVYPGIIVTRRAKRIKRVRVSDAAASDPLLEHRAVEIHQQAQPVAAEPEVGHQLRFVDRGYLIDCFDFKDKAVVHDNIHLVQQSSSKPL